MKLLKMNSKIAKALAECQKISQKTKSRLTILRTTLEKILNYESEKVVDAVKYLTCYVDTIAVSLFSFDVHNAMKYLPEIDGLLSELTKLVCRIEKDLETSGVVVDDVIDDLEIAQIMAIEIFQKLNNAVDKAQSENMWLGGSTLASGFAGYVAAVTDYVGAHPVSAIFECIAIGTAFRIPGRPVASTVAGIIGVGLALGLFAYIPYAIKRTGIQAEAKNRIITLNAEIVMTKIMAQRLLRTESGKSREQEIKDLIAMLEKLEGNYE